MAYSEVQFPSQHCAVRNQQFQNNMQFYPGMNGGFSNMGQQKTWFANQDHNANDNYPGNHYLRPVQRPSPTGPVHSGMWNVNQPQRYDVTMYNSQQLAPLQSSGNFPPNQAYRQRINSAASDGCPSNQSGHWMPVQSPTMWSPEMSNSTRSRQPSITDGGHRTPDNYFPNQMMRPGSFQPNQCLPQNGMNGSFMGTPSPGSSNPNSPPMMQIMNPPQQIPPPMNMMTQQQPQGLVAPKAPAPQGKGSDWELECMGVNIRLENSDLWKNFESVTTEMVISKHGRRMFPVLEYALSGLNPNKLYNVFLDFVLASNYVWKYVDQAWHATGQACNEEPGFHPGQRVFLHPDSPAPGDVWNKKGASFSKMKLSNHLHNEKEKIITLRTLHKYQPRLHIVEVEHTNPSMQSNLRTFVLPKTVFMTVTLYHDTDVAQLKINLNPFARSFRDKTLSTKTSDGNSSSNSSMSQSLSPLTSADDVDTSGHQEPVTGRDVQVTPSDIVKIENPVNSIDLEKAKLFLNKQLSVMSKLVQKSEELERNSNKSGVPNIALPDLNYVSSEPAGETLEELLKPQTVHHFGPSNDASQKEKTSNKPASTNTLADYQLLNVDRCFPPNAVAPLSGSLPFDPKLIMNKQDKAKGILPAFYGCNLYREQAAAAAKSCEGDKGGSTANSLPVIYVPSPKSTAANNEKSSPVRNPASVTPQCFSLDAIASPSGRIPNITLPTLSPSCIRDILDSEDLDDDFLMTSLKRKHCLDDNDTEDDVFLNSPENFDFFTSQPKRGCYEPL